MAADAERETDSIIAAIKAGAFRQDKQPRETSAHGRAWPGLEKAIAFLQEIVLREPKGAVTWA